MAKVLQPSFTSGEISPSLYARVDLARYQTGLRTCRNFFVRPHGGVSNRSGTEFVSELTGGEYRLIPFIFSTEQAYMLTFGPGLVRVFANGGFVQNLTTFTVTSVTVTGTGPYTRTITTSGAHGLTIGDVVDITGIVATGVYDLNGTWTVLSVPGATTFTVKSASSSSGGYTSGGLVSVQTSIDTPYAEADLDALRFAQSADVLTVVHPDYPPHEFRRLSANSFTFTEAEYSNGPFLDLNTDETVFVHASGRSGVVTLTASSAIFNANHVGALFYLEQRDGSEILPWEASKVLVRGVSSTLGLVRSSDGKTYKCITNFTPSGAAKMAYTGTIRPIHDRGVEADGDGTAANITDVERTGVEWEYQDSGFGVLRITAYSSGTSVSAQVLSPLPDSVIGGAVTAGAPWTMTGDGVDTTLAIAGATSENRYDYEVTFDGVIQNPYSFEVDATTDVLTFYTAPANGVSVSARELSQNYRSDLWALGAWSEDQGYPSVVTYYDDRLVFAASRERPQTVWMSKVGNYSDFGQSVPIVDDDGITFTMNARQINDIRDLIPLDNLIAMTSAGAWKITDGQDQVLTPTTVGFKPQSYRGADSLRSRVVGTDALFIQNNGTKLRTLGYNFQADKFTGTNLSILSEHLLKQTATAVDMDYADEPHTLVYVVRSDGVLLTLTYDIEQEVIGWARHDFENGLVERVCTIPEDGEDAVYLVINRTIDGDEVRYLERVATRTIVDVADCCFLDSSLVTDGTNAGATTMTLTGGSTWAVEEELTLTSSAVVFAVTDVGDEIWLTDPAGGPDLRCVILAQNSGVSVDVSPQADVPVGLQGVATTAWAFARDTFSGLDHLEGETVGVLADGNETDQVVVSGGSVTLASPAVKVRIGLPIIADIETLDLTIPGANTIRDSAKRVPQVKLIVQETRAIKAGPDADNLDEFPMREYEGYDESIELLSGVAVVNIPCSWDRNGRVLIRQTSPLPITILGMIPEIDVGRDS